MEFSLFARKFSARTGILELMDDLGQALEDSVRLGREVAMLGGGNPAHIREVNDYWRKAMHGLMAREDDFERAIANYDSPQGRGEFLDAAAEMLEASCGWKITAKNIAVVNGSQSGFFYLSNLFAGRYEDGSKRKLLFPLMPEYIGYADQSVFAQDLRGLPARIEEHGSTRFKYRLDLGRLRHELGDPDHAHDYGALCVSRPTNPSGNVISDEELHQISSLALNSGLPFIIDGAYGLPFPGVLFTKAEAYWDKHVVLTLSLSKLGLPGLRTGLVLADEKIIQALSSMNAVFSLSSGSLGPALTLPAFLDGTISQLSKDVIQPFYAVKRQEALKMLDGIFGAAQIDFRLHESEGAFFFWIWLPDFVPGTRALYEKLKEKDVLVVPGSYFFFGMDQGDDAAWAKNHGNGCFRINFARPREELERGISIIARTIREMNKV